MREASFIGIWPLSSLLDFVGVNNVPQLMRLLDARPWLAVRLLFASLLTFT